jgi:hypothetical protein
MSAPAASPPAPTRPLVLLFLVMLGFTLWFTTRAWHVSILDRHEFRQLQTAESTYWMKEAGYKLDYETPVFGPPWSIPMEFPVYQWIVATTSRLLGMPLEGTARGASLFFFLATLPAVYLLAGFFALPPSRRLLVVSAVLASPTYLFYARTFMIETTALCFSVWFLYALGRAVRDNCIRCAVGATVFATLAALAKTTTFIIFLVPGAVIFLWLWLPRWRRPDEPGARVSLRAVLGAVPVLVSVTVAWWWVKHADHVKDSNPFSGFLTSRELVKWNWGTLEQRMSGEFWSANWSNISSFVLGEVPLAVLLLCATLVEAPVRRVAAWCAAFFLGGVLLFSNLFYHHDYYYCANALLLLFGAGVLLAGVWDNLRLPLGARVLALLLFFGGQLLLYYRGYAEHARHPPTPPPGIAAVIQASVPPDGVVLIYGWDWSSKIPYYSQRRAITVPEGREDEFKVLGDILKNLPPRHLAAMLVRHDPRRIDRLGFVRERTNRFNLSPAPFATSEEGELYLPEDAMPVAAASLQGRSFADVTLNTRPRVDPNEAKLQVNDLSAIDFPMTTPRPVGARSMFGISVGEVGIGRKVILAHPDSELSFAPPAGATRIIAEVGIAAGAYAPDASAVTDGVSVEIFELRANGLRRVLFRRDLNPAKEPGDRGPQQITLDAAGPFNGTLVFKITPGPQNNLVNDWAYWGRIEIR